MLRRSRSNIREIFVLTFKAHGRPCVRSRGTKSGEEVGGSDERCPLTSNFDAKNSQSEADHAFDCHILAPVKRLLS